MRALEHWRRLLETPALVEAAADIDPTDVASVARLRRSHDADLVACALDLAAARRKAERKWPGRDVVADPEGVEMATSSLAGAWKAQRLAAVGRQVIDLCCGIGGDAMAMADAGLDVRGVDQSDVRAWMCALNAACTTTVADVTTLPLDEGAIFHLDPARRSEGRRRWRYDDLQPGPAFIESLARRTGAIKLGPGVDTTRLPPGELELISEHTSLTQGVLWTGSLARHRRRATVLPSGASIAGDPGPPPIGPARRYVHTIDASVERAGLLNLLCAHVDAPMLHDRLGLLTSDAPIDSPFTTSFELIERLPWRLETVKSWLMTHDGAIPEIKTRAKAVDPDTTQARLRAEGSICYTIFILRFDAQIDALITRRVSS